MKSTHVKSARFVREASTLRQSNLNLAPTAHCQYRGLWLKPFIIAFLACEVCSSVSIGNQTIKILGNQTMYFQNHHFLVPGPHRVRGTSNSRNENGFWSKEMLTIFSSSPRIRLWIHSIPSKISILSSHSSMSFTQRNTRTTTYRRLTSKQWCKADTTWKA